MVDVSLDDSLRRRWLRLRTGEIGRRGAIESEANVPPGAE